MVVPRWRILNQFMVNLNHYEFRDAPYIALGAKIAIIRP
jgi:hypothetical protein